MASSKPPPLPSRTPKYVSVAIFAVVSGLGVLRMKKRPSPGNASFVPSVR